MKMKFSIFAFLLFLTCDLSAQTDTFSVVLRVINIDASTAFLRWGPTNYASWKAGNEYGYTLKRYDLKEDGTLMIDSEKNLGTFQVNLLNLEALGENNSFAGIAAGCIFGDSLEILPPGGATLTNVYQKSKETGSRFGWSMFAADQDFEVAMAMGLGYKDKEMVEGTKYRYIVALQTTGVQYVGRLDVEAKKPDEVTVKPDELAYLPQDKGVLLEWKPNESEFTSYDVERSTDGENWSKVNKNPVAYLRAKNSVPGDRGTVSFLDSLADNTTTYIYRVKGRTPFAMLSLPSDTIHAKGKEPRLAFQWHIDEVVETEEHVQIKWVFPGELQKNIDGFDILRSSQPDGPFTKINSELVGRSYRSFIDPSPAPSNYYSIFTRDTNGYTYQTFSRLGQPKDNTAPAIPNNLSGSCNLNGLVNLHWEKSSSSDVMGYRVYFSNVVEGDYLQVTSVWVKDTFFYHSIDLETLSEEVFFTVTAIDFRENQSEMSIPVKILRPDIVPPSPPIIRSHKATLAEIEFFFEPSSSTVITEYRFERRLVGIPGWVPLTTFSATNWLLKYSDNTGNKRKWYEYRLVAIDDAGLMSSSAIVKIKKIDDGIRHSIQNFSTGPVSSPKSISLGWSYAKDADLIGFEIIRAIGDSTRRRSYAYLPYPSNNNAATNPGWQYSVGDAGNLLHVEFTDFDVLIKHLPQINTYQYFGSAVATTPNQSVPTPTNPTLSGTYTIVKPNNLAGQTISGPVKFYYWVVARFADGASSPIAGAVLVEL